MFGKSMMAAALAGLMGAIPTAAYTGRRETDDIPMFWGPSFRGPSTPRHAPNGRGQCNAARLKRESKRRRARKCNLRGVR
jgi:hypothetical protein